MADMAAEDALNNNDTVKRYIARLRRRKDKKCWAKCFYKFLKYYKKRIFASVMCLALITATIYNIQSKSLPPKKPNLSKKLDIQPKPIEYGYAGKNISKLQRKVLGIREKQRTLEDKIRMMHRIEYVRAVIKQDGGYVNTKQANKIINDALQLYDADKLGVVDYACMYTGASILDTYIGSFVVPKQNQTMAFADVELRILDNHGHEDLTCVHRFRVHGNP